MGLYGLWPRRLAGWLLALRQPRAPPRAHPCGAQVLVAAKHRLGEVLSAFEFLDRQSLEVTLAHLPGARDPLPACQVRAPQAQRAGGARGRSLELGLCEVLGGWDARAGGCPPVHPHRHPICTPPNFLSFNLTSPTPSRPPSTCWWRRRALWPPTMPPSWRRSSRASWAKGWCSVSFELDGGRRPAGQAGGVGGGGTHAGWLDRGAGKARGLRRVCTDRDPTTAHLLRPPSPLHPRRCRRHAGSGQHAGAGDVAPEGRHHRGTAPPG